MHLFKLRHLQLIYCIAFNSATVCNQLDLPVPHIWLFQNMALNPRPRSKAKTIQWIQHPIIVYSLWFYVSCTNGHHPFLRYDNFKIGIWNPKLKAIGKVKGEVCLVDLTSYWFMSLLFRFWPALPKRHSEYTGSLQNGKVVFVILRSALTLWSGSGHSKI